MHSDRKFISTGRVPVATYGWLVVLDYRESFIFVQVN
jgi:hypothetical protein